MRIKRIGAIAAAAGLVLVAAVISPALGGPSLKSLVKKEVSKQISKATGPQGPAGAQGPTGPPGPPGAPGTPAEPAGGTLPSSSTLRGVVGPSVVSDGAGLTAAGNGVSFAPYELAARPLAHVIGVGGASTANCPGSAASPAAASGHLCVYLTFATASASTQVVLLDISGTADNGVNYNVNTATSTTLGDGRVSPFGFTATVSRPTGNGVELRGTWAVTG